MGQYPNWYWLNGLYPCYIAKMEISKTYNISCLQFIKVPERNGGFAKTLSAALWQKFLFLHCIFSTRFWKKNEQQFLSGDLSTIKKHKHKIFDVHFLGNSIKVDTIANNFWSSTIWAIQIQVSFPELKNP